MLAQLACQFVHVISCDCSIRTMDYPLVDPYLQTVEMDVFACAATSTRCEKGRWRILLETDSALRSFLPLLVLLVRFSVWDLFNLQDVSIFKGPLLTAVLMGLYYSQKGGAQFQDAPFLNIHLPDLIQPSIVVQGHKYHLCQLLLPDHSKPFSLPLPFPPPVPPHSRNHPPPPSTPVFHHFHSEDHGVVGAGQGTNCSLREGGEGEVFGVEGGELLAVDLVCSEGVVGLVKSGEGRDVEVDLSQFRNVVVD